MLANARIDIQAETAEEMTGRGIVTVVRDLAEETETTEVCLGAMPDAMITIVHQGETVTFSKEE